MQTRILILIAGIIILAFSLRFYTSQTTGAWADEMSVYALGRGYNLKSLLLQRHWDVAHPPLLYVAIRLYWLLKRPTIFLISEIRPFFVWASSLAVVPLYLVTKPLLKTKASLFLTVWYALHPFMIKLGYSLRPYALLQLLFPIAAFSFYPSVWKKPWQIVTWNFLFIFMFFWDYASIWFFVTFIIYQLTQGVNQFWLRVKQLSGFIFLLFLWLPQFIYRLPDLLQLTNYAHVNLSATFVELFGFNPQVFYPYLSQMSSLFALILILVIHHKKQTKQNFLLFVLIFLPLIMSFIFSLMVGPILISQNLLWSVFVFLCIFAFGIKKWGTAVGIILTLVHLASFYTQISPNIIGYNAQEFGQEVDFPLKVKRVVYFSFDGNFKYGIYYHYLKNGYWNKTNSENVFIKNGRELTINYFTLSHVFGRDGKIPDVDPKSEQSFFISYGLRDFSESEKNLINQFCELPVDTYMYIKKHNELNVYACGPPKNKIITHL